MPAQAGVQFFLHLALVPLEFTPDLIGGRDERKPHFSDALISRASASASAFDNPWMMLPL